MRTLICALVVILGGGIARAQPGQTPAGPSAPPAPVCCDPAPPPYAPAPAPYVPPPYGYAPQPYALTAEEQALLADGEISDGQHIGGGVAALFFGFGTGQAIQGRWSETGWIFTLGEAGSLGLLIYGLSENDCFLSWGSPCTDTDRGDTAMVAGLLGFLGFHVWEIVDAFAAPPRHNARIRNLRMRLGYPPPSPYYGRRIIPYLVPRDADGAVAGLSLRF